MHEPASPVRLMIRLLQRCIVAFAAAATLVSPAWGPMVAHGGQEGRTLLMAVCTSQGGVVRTEIPLTGGLPTDRDTDGVCHHCPLCVPGADRPVAGPVPASISVPAASAESERPVARPRTGPAAGAVRVARARDPPSVS
ncbi:MAG: hypothetical protein NDI88_05495 [Lysobacter sp.]|nr:hypothetical protein [Lysobacter sp.]